MTKKYLLHDIRKPIGSTFTSTLEDILNEINSDRPEWFIQYDATDWEEGMTEFTYWRLA